MKICKLEEMVGERIRIYLMNGFQKSCLLKELGEGYVIVFDEATKREEIIMKHAISTIVT